jgi:hypothetical protein
MILARSCFGTQSFRESATDVELVSLPLLAHAVKDCMRLGNKTVPAMVDRCRVLKRDLIRQANARTVLDTFEVNEVRFEIPLIQFDPAAAARFRQDLL